VPPDTFSTECVYDRSPPVAPRATAFRYHTGEAIGAAARTDALLATIERKYGPWDLDPAAGKAWRRGFAGAFHEAFAAMPVVLAAPSQTLRYAVISGPRMAALDTDGRVGGAVNNALWGLAVPLVADPDSPFHWDRSGRGVPCRDDVTAALFSAHMVLPDGVALLRQAVRPRPWSKQGGSEVFHQSVAAALKEDGFDPDGRKRSRCAYAAGTLLARYRWIAACGFNLAALRLYDPEVLRLARRTGNLDSYNWLAAVGRLEDRAAVTSRRRQFAIAYPELVGSVALSDRAPVPGGSPSDERARAIGAAVDRAERVGPLVAAHRGWPKWVGKLLAGRLSATGVLGRALHAEQMARFGDRDGAPPLGADLARLLAALGPAWRPRGGDASIIAFMTSLSERLNLDPSAISSLCPHPGSGPSPWKRAWKRIPPAMRARGGRPASPGKLPSDVPSLAAYIMDAVKAFEDDVARPLTALCREPDVRPRADRQPRFGWQEFGGQHRIHGFALGGLSLAALIGVSIEFHERLDAIRLAKHGTPARGTPMLSRWQPLFAPFSMAGSRVTAACLSAGAELDSNGSAMGHCVSSYAMGCLEGVCHIVAFHHGGKAIATAELRGSLAAGFTAVQMRGFRNGPAPDNAGEALRLILLELNGGRTDGHSPGAGGLPMTGDSGRVAGAATGFAPLGLSVTPDAVLEAGLARRLTAIGKHRAAMAANYDVNDPAAVDRVVTAWRFAMPDRVRAAWERGTTPAERISGAGGVLAGMAAKAATPQPQAIQADGVA